VRICGLEGDGSPARTFPGNPPPCHPARTFGGPSRFRAKRRDFGVLSFPGGHPDGERAVPGFGFGPAGVSGVNFLVGLLQGVIRNRIGGTTFP